MIGLVWFILSFAIGFFVVSLIDMIHCAITGQDDDIIMLIISFILAGFNIILALCCLYLLQ